MTNGSLSPPEKPAEQHSAAKAKLYDCSWESHEHYECPEWFRDANFGVYMNDAS